MACAALWPLCVTSLDPWGHCELPALSPVSDASSLQQQPLDLGAARRVGETGNNLCLQSKVVRSGGGHDFTVPTAQHE